MHAVPKSRRGWNALGAAGAGSAMEWQWYHYLACIALGVLLKMVRNALGLGPTRGARYTQAAQGSSVTTEIKKD